MTQTAVSDNELGLNVFSDLTGRGGMTVDVARIIDGTESKIDLTRMKEGVETAV